MDGQTNGHTNGYHGNASSDKEDDDEAASDAEAEKKEESDLEADNIVLDMVVLIMFFQAFCIVLQPRMACSSMDGEKETKTKCQTGLLYS